MAKTAAQRYNARFSRILSESIEAKNHEEYLRYVKSMTQINKNLNDQTPLLTEAEYVAKWGL